VTGRPRAADELVDVVDEDDRVVATVRRAEIRAGNLRHRCVFIVVRRSDGRVLVHRRSDDKDVWPSAWDIAVGGVVAAGEGWDEAAARELTEEVGIAQVPLRFVGRARYDDADVSEVAQVYEATWDGPVTFADGEVVAAEWLTPAEIGRWTAERTVCPDSLALAGHFVR
jgi:isopentenyldiphosphate isomerase